MSRRAVFRQSDIERALKAAQAVGLAVAGYELDADGRLVVFTADGRLPEPIEIGDDLDRELADWEADHGKD